MYEIKAGYIRSQFYSIPTGKKVEAAPGDTLFTNAADLTPEVVAGIRMKSDIRHLLLGMEVSESFAVGKVAVMSPAATVMYIANADSRANAVAASAAAEAMSAARKSTETIPLAPTPEMGELYRQLGVLRKSDPAKKAKSLEIIRKPEYGGFATWDEFVDSNPGKETLGKLLNELK